MGKSVRRPRVDRVLTYGAPHGSHKKSLIVLHQTISPDHAGLSDIAGVAGYLAHVGYAIHVITDVEGNSGAVLPELETAIYYHAASNDELAVNTRSIGIEQISYVSGDPRYWWRRTRQLHKTARWIAYLSKRHDIRPFYDPLCINGVAGHADVTKAAHVQGGHSDCKWPTYPTKFVCRLARGYLKTGWT